MSTENDAIIFDRLKAEVVRKHNYPQKRRYYIRNEVRLTPLEVAERIPEDTRDLFAKLMGDPLPGRSALDKRGAAQ